MRLLIVKIKSLKWQLLPITSLMEISISSTEEEVEGTTIIEVEEEVEALVINHLILILFNSLISNKISLIPLLQVPDKETNLPNLW